MINKLLVVDDEKRNTELVVRFLKMKGFSVFTANYAVQALTSAKKGNP